MNNHIFYPTERELIAELRDGHERAYRYLFDHHYEQLCLIAMGFMHSKPEAESVVVETIFSVWEHRQRISDAIPLRHYLAYCVRNKCIDALRSEKVRQQVLNGYAETLKVDIVEDTEKEAELAAHINAAIDRLPKECRQIMIWSKLEGLKREDIANRLGISINTVKYHLKHGMELLRKDLLTKPISIILLISDFFS